jgi:hypothetical protein
LGRFILASFLFVFGTMVEFAVVLVGKQKGDWNHKASKMKEKHPIFRSKHSEKQSQCLTSIGKVEPTEGAKSVSKTTKKQEITNAALAVDRFTFLKEMPRTTKVDFTAFAIFNISYAMFVIIYFLSYSTNLL